MEDVEEFYYRRREVLPKSDPFNLSNENFLKLFRLTKPDNMPEPGVENEQIIMELIQQKMKTLEG